MSRCPVSVLVESARLLNRLAQSLLTLMLEAPTRSQSNVMFSPMALAVSLAVLAAGSEAETRQELCQLLQMQLPELELLIEKFKVDDRVSSYFLSFTWQLILPTTAVARR